MRQPLLHDPSVDHEFLGSVRTGEGTWELEMTRGLVTPVDRLYGGAGLAVAVAALESATRRPLRWITCQFSSTAVVGETLTVQVEVDAEGRSVTQAGVVARAGERTVLRVLAALGEARPDLSSGTWVTMPDVPDPGECEAVRMPVDTTDSFFDRVDRRHAAGPRIGQHVTGEPQPAGFAVCQWSRVVGNQATSPAMLAWQSDTVPASVGAGLGEALGGTSLDNTLRIVDPRPADWILMDIRPTATASGYAYGQVHLWTPDGVLLGTASQTLAVRPFPR